MENSTFRTLAYVLAKPIHTDDSETISGGGISACVTTNQTLKTTASSAQETDGHYDIAFDC